MLENLGGLSHGIVLSRRSFKDSQAKILDEDLLVLALVPETSDE